MISDGSGTSLMIHRTQTKSTICDGKLTLDLPLMIQSHHSGDSETLL